MGIFGAGTAQVVAGELKSPPVAKKAPYSEVL